MHGLEQERGDGQVADLLLFELAVDLGEPGVLQQRVLELLEDERVRVDVLEVVVGRDGVEVPQHDVANALVLVGLRQAASTLPERATTGRYKARFFSKYRVIGFRRHLPLNIGS